MKKIKIKSYHGAQILILALLKRKIEKRVIIMNDNFNEDFWWEAITVMLSVK